MPGLNGRSLAYPRGKVIGGCSAINAMIYMRGQAADYDHWRQLGLTGWGWDDVRPIFRKQVDHFSATASITARAANGASSSRACAGTFSMPSATRPRNTAFRRSTDFNTGDNEGCGYFHVNQKRGRRWSPRAAFSSRRSAAAICGWKPAASPKRSCSRASAPPACASGRTGESKVARCRGEVILSAGAIGSLQLLLLSGIGPAAHLQEHRHSGRARQAPASARNLQDHLQLRLIYKVTGREDAERDLRARCSPRAGMGLDYALRRRGPLTMAPSQLGAFTRSDPDQDRPNIQYHVQPLSLDKFGDPLHPFPAFTVERRQSAPDQPRRHPAALAPIPPTSPSIQPNYLSTPEDRRVAADSIRVTRKIVAQPALQAFQPVEYLPGEQVRSDDETALEKAAGDIGTTIFHPVGTARMGRPRRSDGGGGRAPARDRHRGPARDRCLGHADDHLRQYQFAHHDDRREGRGDDPRGCERLRFRRYEQGTSGGADCRSGS